MSLASLALEVAEQAHAGQLDKAGQVYILHPIRVGCSFDDENAQAVGFLHDVIEDTDVTEESLRMVFPDHIVDAVVALSRRDGESYDAFIRRCAENSLARRVKRADIRDNLRPGYSKDSLRRRYVAALRLLLEYEEVGDA